MKEKNPLTFWVIVGICFSVVVITWLPITFKRMKDMFGSLSEQTKTTSEEAKKVWETQGRQEINVIINEISGLGSSTHSIQPPLSEFTASLKDQLLQNASSSATSTQ
ncbi:hypothetical protein HY621_01715 [Candidatus Uhrbacteria bacterium]|nr:hypothetical protein [Candidatus Uhrbacteria bacterium]